MKEHIRCHRTKPPVFEGRHDRQKAYQLLRTVRLQTFVNSFPLWRDAIF